MFFSDCPGGDLYLFLVLEAFLLKLKYGLNLQLHVVLKLLEVLMRAHLSLEVKLPPAYAHFFTFSQITGIVKSLRAPLKAPNTTSALKKKKKTKKKTKKNTAFACCLQKHNKLLYSDLYLGRYLVRCW